MLEKKLYRIILKATSLISLLCIVGNFASGFPMNVNVKWAILFLISILAMILERKSKCAAIAIFMFFVFVIVGFLPFAFVDSGGSNNNATGYIFLVLISIVYLFKGWKRIALVVTEIMIFEGLITLERFKPEWVAVYSGQTQYIDRMIQMPLILFASYWMVSRFADAYERQKQKQKSYSEALERANLALYEQARKDTLTGLSNRMDFDEALNRIYEEKSYAENPISVVLFDIDHFKKINDTLGHIEADKILVAFANDLKRLCGQNSLISRWGGDEFGMIVYGSEEETLELLEQIRNAYREIVYSRGIHSGISVGGIQWKYNMEVDDVLRQADAQLYESKYQGRNRISFGSDSIETA